MRMFRYIFISLICFTGITTGLQASHAVGADLTYSCTPNPNEYIITLKFYRDCGGVNAPGSVTVSLDNTCNGQGTDLQLTLQPLAGTGQEVSPICPSQQTTCNGGPYPGIQEWVYQGTVTLNGICNDWVISYNICCRNGLITNIPSPTSYSQYVASHLDNTVSPCNNSPYFTNPPVPFICLGQTYCFNHGAIDPDNDSLVYSLINPMSNGGTPIPYNAPFTPQQPLSSMPPVSFNSATGDICITPTNLESTVVAMLVEEYRNGVLIGQVIRDIQINVINCNNNIPSISGMDGNPINSYNTDTVICAGSTLNFSILSNDPDQGQILTMSWNNGITGATFNIGGSPHPVGVFSWTPTAADVSNVPYCFTVTIADDNCPYQSSFTQSYCVTVSGPSFTLTSNNANCGASNGSAQVTGPGGNPPFTYQWSAGSQQSFQTGVSPGWYSVTVSDNSNCSAVDSIYIGNNGGGNISTTVVNNVSCYNVCNGAATATVTGAQQPVNYLWDAGTGWQQSATATGLCPGNYYVSATDANGCTLVDSILISGPSAPLTCTASVVSNYNGQDISCYLAADGQALVAANGGTPPYTFLWDPQALSQNTALASNLGAGSYSVTATDAMGCNVSTSAVLNQPSVLVANATITSNYNGSPISCYNSSDGSADVSALGGTPGYSYQWGAATGWQTGTTASALGSGSYSVTVTDVNGCIGISAVTVTPPPPLTMTFASFDAICYGSCDGYAVALPAGGTGAYNYLWSPAPPSGQYTANAGQLCAGNWTLALSDANGCLRDTSFSINQPTPISYQLSSSQPHCGQNDGFAWVSNLSGGNSGYTFLWDASASGQQNDTATSLQSGSYCVTVSDVNGCYHTECIGLTDIPAPVVQAVSSAALCSGQCNGSASVNVSGGTAPFQFQWNDSQSQTGTTATGLCAAMYEVTVTDSSGCSSSTSVAVAEPTNVTAILGNDTTVCSGASALVSAMPAGGNGGPYNVNWSNGYNGVQQYVNPTSDTCLWAQVMDATGCLSDSLTVCINVAAPVQLAALPDTNICEGDSISFSAFVTSGTPPFQFLWSTGSSAQSIIAIPTNYPANSQYSITVSDACNTYSNTSALVSFYPTPTVDLSAINPAGCVPLPVTFNGSSSGAESCFIDYGDGNISAECGMQTHVYTDAGTYEPTLWAESDMGCKAWAQLPFQVFAYPLPYPGFATTPNSTSVLDPKLTIEDLSTGGVTQWQYVFYDPDGTALGSSSAASPSFLFPPDSGMYSIVQSVTDYHGCTSDSIAYFHIGDFFTYWVPNAFTPDGDGRNDKFYGKGSGIEAQTMVIFDRWGERLFESDDPNAKWDGTYMDHEVKTDVYVYIIKVQDFHHRWHEYNGHVSLIR